MMNVRYLFLLLFSASTLCGIQERITLFKSHIMVNADATIEVQESIQVIAQGISIIHGIVREFPARYKDFWQTDYVVDFTVQKITHNGRPVQFRIEDVSNGKRIFIGDKGVEVPHGNHIYTITYATNRQLGFFENHDELYWNVTGNGWRLPVDKVEAQVTLPGAVTTAEGYTGRTGSERKDYTVRVNGNQVTFVTIRALKEREGLTIAVTFPKGIVQEPQWYQKLYWFFRDNMMIMLFTVMLFGLLFLAFLLFFLQRYRNKPGVVIPLFYPPQGMTPSMVGSMKALGFKDEFFSADVVDLAVRGFITIVYKDKGLAEGSYTLQATQQCVNFLADKSKADSYDFQLLSILFQNDPVKSGVLELSKTNSSSIKRAQDASKRRSESETRSYITHPRFYSLLWYIFGTVLFSIFVFSQFQHGIYYFFAILYGALLALINKFSALYSSTGRKFQDEIDGFELYLSTAEKNLMDMVGTPPTKTPELYEKYLPYAMVLGIEKQWTQKFTTVFEALAQDNRPYVPVWYVGRPLGVGPFLESGLSSSFNSAIASASTPPGRSSGSGGGGSSGGGGGGGGGGGW